MALEYGDVTEQIIGAAFEVYRVSSFRVSSVFHPWLI